MKNEFFRINCNGSHGEFFDDFEKSKMAYDRGMKIVFDDSMEGNIYNSVVTRFEKKIKIPETWHRSRIYYSNGDVNLIDNFNKDGDHIFGNAVSNPLGLLDRTKFYIKRGKTGKILEQNPLMADKHFLLLCAVPKLHRYRLIDELHFHGLIHNGWFTWLERRMPTPVQWIQSGRSKWRGAVRTLDLDKDTIEQGIAQESVPKEYYNSFFDIALESIVDDRIIFYTEKTWKNFLRGKLFLPLGGQNGVKYLQSLGFKLYTELFNYDYDALTNEHRIQAFNQEIIRLCNTPLRTLKQTYMENAREIDAKLQYNKELAYSLEAHQWGGDFDTVNQDYTVPEDLKSDYWRNYDPLKP